MYMVVMYLENLYNFAKENSGPLKLGIHTVEGTIKTSKFIDRKIEP